MAVSPVPETTLQVDTSFTRIAITIAERANPKKRLATMPARGLACGHGKEAVTDFQIHNSRSTNHGLHQRIDFFTHHS